MGNKDNLENLVRSGGLQAEPPVRKECLGLQRSAIDRLKDAHNPALSFASRFDLAYNAAHALALTACACRVSGACLGCLVDDAVDVVQFRDREHLTLHLAPPIKDTTITSRSGVVAVITNHEFFLARYVDQLVSTAKLSPYSHTLLTCCSP